MAESHFNLIRRFSWPDSTSGSSGNCGIRLLRRRPPHPKIARYQFIYRIRMAVGCIFWPLAVWYAMAMHCLTVVALAGRCRKKI
ncbi:hypothetical protein CPSG_00094 [Coccidioides posadasii str. Silveira]|uniref:Uncharacterized protein n=1 Tax=Coccidioides posadasii (strain RMSCC 757 / Silveira) TaxID=443226 RepID=E9CTV2_COCPS|nr:hypothetical protein CPSG_00094 [Coccidioides posadasii str. Silveira]